MQIYPSRSQRMLLFENCTYRRENTQGLIRAFISGSSAMRLSPQLHCITEGGSTVLFNGYTLKKALGGRSLSLLFESLTERSAFDYPFFSKAALSIGNPERIMEELAERGFLIAAGNDEKAARWCTDSGCSDSPWRLFIQLSADPVSPHLYHFSDQMEMGLNGRPSMTPEVLSKVLADFSRRIGESTAEVVVLLTLGDAPPAPEVLCLLFQQIEEWRTGEERNRPARLLILTTVKGISAMSALSALPRQCTFYISLASHCGSSTAFLSQKERSRRWREAGTLIGLCRERFGSLIPLVPISAEEDEGSREAFDEFLSLASPEVLRLQLPYLTSQCSPAERSEAGRRLAEKAFRVFQKLRQQGIRETTVGSLALSFSEESPRRSICACNDCRQISYSGDGRMGSCPLSHDYGNDARPSLQKVNCSSMTSEGESESCPGDCIAHALCQGGCAYAASLTEAESGNPDIFQCSLMRSLTGCMIREWSSASLGGAQAASALSFPSDEVKVVKELSGVSSELLFEEFTGGASLLDRQFCISPFVFLIRRRGYSALYHSLTLKKLFGDEALVSLYMQSRRGGKSPPRSLPLREYLNSLSCSGDLSQAKEDLAMLLDLEFLVPQGSDPMEPLRRARENRVFSRHRIGLIYLLVSNECNLRCRYCSIECADRKPEGFSYSHMSPLLARKGIRLFLSLLDSRVKSPQVVFYGGEPLLNWNVIDDSLGIIRDMEQQGLFNGAAAECSIVCNGTLVTPEIAKKIKSHSLRASVSIDGLARHHDLYRRYRDGRPSWDDSLRGYRLLKDHLGECGISCTLGLHNIDDIEEISEFFASRLECRGLGFNMIKGLPAGSDLDISSRQVTEKIIKAYEIFRRYGVYEDRITRKIRSFVDEEPWIYDCAGYGGQIALCADGAIGPCHIAADAHRFIWGNIDEDGIAGKIEKSSLTREWCRRSPLLMDECSDCIGLGICGGGCADEAFVKCGSISALDRAFCEHCRLLIEWMCDDLVKKMKDTGNFTGIQGRKPVKGARHL
ncbi:MAG: radical SAM protein [Candidatus Xenobiia bacterium LiM19]